MHPEGKQTHKYLMLYFRQIANRSDMQEILLQLHQFLVLSRFFSMRILKGRYLEATSWIECKVPALWHVSTCILNQS